MFLTDVFAGVKKSQTYMRAARANKRGGLESQQVTVGRNAELDVRTSTEAANT